MNSSGRPSKSSLERNAPEPAPRKKSSLWHRRSLRASNDQQRHRHTDSLPRTVKPKHLLVDYSDPQRSTIVLEKEDNETFGFDVQTHGLQLRSSSAVEVCTFVSRVEDNSAAESAGLTAGDVIISINGASIEGCSHQHVLDLIRASTNRLKMETVCGSVVTWIELEKKVNMLKQSLNEKLVELQALTLQEQRLIRGHLKENSLSTDSSEVPSSPRGHRSLRVSSNSSYRSLMTDDSDQGSVFGDLSSPGPCSAASSTKEERFFSQRFSLTSGHYFCQTVGRSSSSSLASSSSSSISSQSPTWNETRSSTLFGTLPRKGKRTNVRKNILKLIPGLHQRSVEEEET
ncbi:cytohesin-interacting protein [Dunckerocampus dactyliophorus]|uniref:cytohesin-interacting protein n=1 Tax=Dunckerocampus dactyliophorus TaxID=161453 RepID=UPI002406493F|nr:cytohesin-interacting protein [Dunckerocampus dactyliophorus]